MNDPFKLPTRSRVAVAKMNHQDVLKQLLGSGSKGFFPLLVLLFQTYISKGRS